MKKTFTILFASTALAVGAGIPTWSAMHGELPSQASGEAFADASNEGASLLFAGHDRHLSRDHRRRAGRDGHHGEGDRHGDDEDEDEDDDDDDDDEDNGSRGGAATGPAPVGTAIPPKNGLFGSGAAPKVKVN
ncbi:MAG: hypothetical protein K0S42_1743 [Microvirga sp.]|jgi:hypothetical protein|nr:hypothetical protein [Microvirga sp.]